MKSLLITTSTPFIAKPVEFNWLWAIPDLPASPLLVSLYVRPLTSLNLTDRQWDDIRLACYRVGREFLLVAGYR